MPDSLSVNNEAVCSEGSVVGSRSPFAAAVGCTSLLSKCAIECETRRSNVRPFESVTTKFVTPVYYYVIRIVTSIWVRTTGSTVSMHVPGNCRFLC